MKRTPLKRRQKPLRRTPLKRSTKPLRKRKKSTPLKKLQTRLWGFCREYALKKYPKTCYACGAENLEGVNCQLGHCIASVLCPFELDYHPDNLRWECFRCNIRLGGNAAVFLERLRREFGQAYIDNLFLMKNQPRIVKPSLQDYENYIEKYKRLISEL